MNSIATSCKSRELRIDFSLYTFGDPVFKLELAGLIIDNIKNLQASLQKAMNGGEVSPFLYECHKAAPTIMMLNDDELTIKVRRLRAHFKHEDKLKDVVLARYVNQFEQICDSLMMALSYVAKAA
jgi:hypothetical protein